MHKTTLKFILSITLVFFTSSQTTGESFGDFINNYLPYLNGKPWPKFKLEKYVENNGIWVHPTAAKKFPTLEEFHQDANHDFTTVVLRLPDGRLFKTYNALLLGPYFAEVYSGDFNNDGILDFLAIKPNTGNGLAAERCIGLFAFSAGDSYHFTRVSTLGLGPASLVIDPKSKSFRLIHTDFRQSIGIDKKVHSFFVHRFYTWSASSFRYDDQISPVWVQFLEKPNHQETKLLTTIQKNEGWTKADFEIEW